MEIMTTPTIDEAKQKILLHLERVKQGLSRDIARATRIDKHLVDKAITDLIKQGKLNYVNYGGVTYVTLASETDNGVPA